MRILVLGSDGFIGSNVKAALAPAHDIYAGTILKDGGEGTVHVDLTDKATITQALAQVKPDVIINCAGIVENSAKAALNVAFTTNLLEAAAQSGLTFRRIIVTGSASEYGEVDPKDLPVPETAPLAATGLYGLSKVQETTAALTLARKHHLPVVIARLFNPIGPDMHPRMLIPSLIRQIQEIQAGTRQAIEVSRLDAVRDYIDIRDLAQALKVLAESNPKSDVYNIGSGHSLSNGALIDLILANHPLPKRPEIIQTTTQPEPPAAAQADITRITAELSWRPARTIDQTVKEILHG